MKIAEELKSLYGDRLAQRRAQARIEAARENWLADPSVAAIFRDLEAYGAGTDWHECERLREIASCHNTATRFLEPLVQELCGALRDQPLAHAPFRHQRTGGTSILQLATPGRAALVLLCYDGTETAGPPVDASFSDVERHEIVLAGGADLVMAEVQSEWHDCAAIDCEARRVVAGEYLSFGPTQAKLFRQVHGRMVVLRIARTPADPLPSRVFDLETGRLLHRASGNRAESHREMAMALLGRMGRRDAAPLLAELSQDGSTHFRWQALRECLALDSGEGLAALSHAATDANDPLQSPAAALRAQLLEAHPQLGRMEPVPCPA